EVPTPDGGPGPRNNPPAIMAAPGGSFGLAYLASPAAGGVVAEYLPVGGATPVAAIDSKGIQNDSPSVGVADGPAGPIAAATICNAENDDDACTFAAVSSAGGAT